MAGHFARFERKQPRLDQPLIDLYAGIAQGLPISCMALLGSGVIRMTQHEADPAMPEPDQMLSQAVRRCAVVGHHSQGISRSLRLTDAYEWHMIGPQLSHHRAQLGDRRREDQTFDLHVLRELEYVV